ncbi:sulfotransferase domain-containing protein [Vibrio sp. 10N]|uniref:sulfotransferase domain-containing protein n=1 Tax=Vibrio sp. 10N TaxID=3058938 RepID=UPI0028137B8C|nr:hypothetical protein VB10N_28900 [Vibrio sp. 10N]
MSNNFTEFKHQIDSALELLEDVPQVGKQSLPDKLNDEMVDTQSLLQRCEHICDTHQTNKPKIRAIQHLACSGGTLVENILSAMPNVYLLAESHPFLELPNQKCDSFNVLSSLDALGIPEATGIKKQAYLETVIKAYEKVAESGGELVIVDNAHLDYMSQDAIFENSIIKLLETHFDVISVVLYRDTIDAYSSLALNDFYLGKKLEFSEYCDRALQFLKVNSDKPLITFEELYFSESEFTEKLCSLLQLPFDDTYDLHINDLRSDKLLFWQANENEHYNCKLSTTPSLEAIGEAEAYFEIQKLIKLKDKKIVLIATMPRSGSTWLFNCVREIYKNQEVDLYSEWIEDYVPSNNSFLHIIKVHDPEYRLSSQADVIISTRRDIRNALVSLIRMGWIANEEKQIMSEARRLINCVHPFWKERSKFEIEYSRILAEPGILIRQVCELLQVSAKNEMVEEVVSALSRLRSPKEYDKKTQLHPNHISNQKTDYGMSLSSEVVSRIEHEFTDWLVDNSYITN